VRGLDRRLAQVEAVAQRRQQATAYLRYDLSALTAREQYELDTLLARAGAAFPHETWAQAPLSPDEGERLATLLGRVRVVKEESR
jgi:hypothetical protein